MSGCFYLKARDTQPVFQSTLLNPDGTIYNPTGASALELHVQLEAGTFSRTLTVIGAGSASPNVQYAWAALDWNDTAPGAVNLAAGLWRVECEIVPSAGQRVSFPNLAHRWLLVTPDLGQA